MVPWNSRELWVPRFESTCISMGNPKTQIFITCHGIMLHTWFAIFDGIKGSMEFHRRRNWESQNPMEFHGFFLWNYIRQLVLSKLVVFKLSRIPLYFFEFWVSQFFIIIVFNFVWWIILHISLCLSVSSAYIFFINVCVIPQEPFNIIQHSLRIKMLLKGTFQWASLKLILITKKAHGTSFTVPLDLPNNVWTIFLVPWNSMQYKLQFHGIQCNIFHTPEIHEIPWNF